MEKLKKDIYSKSLDIKNKIKELNNILANLYNIQKLNYNKNIYTIKKNTDKIDSAYKKIGSMRLGEYVDSSDFKEVNDIQKEALKNIQTLQEIYYKKIHAITNDFNGKELSNFRRNFEYLKKAYSEIDSIDTNIIIDKKYKDDADKGMLVNE